MQEQPLPSPMFHLSPVKPKAAILSLPPDSPGVSVIQDGNSDGNRVFSVVIPDGVRGGEYFRVTMAGETMKVKCPMMVDPGERVRVTLPPKSPLSPTDISVIAARHPGPYWTHIPYRAKPGERFQLSVFGAVVNVKVPPGGHEGMRIWFMLGEKKGEEDMADGHAPSLGQIDVPPLCDKSDSSNGLERRDTTTNSDTMRKEDTIRPSESELSHTEEDGISDDETEEPFRPSLRPSTLRGMSFDDDEKTPSTYCSDRDAHPNGEEKNVFHDAVEEIGNRVRRGGRRVALPEPPLYEAEVLCLRYVGGEGEHREYGWEKPDWTTKDLRPTGRNVKDGSTLAKPVTLIANVVGTEQHLSWERPAWTKQTLKVTEKGQRAKNGETLAAPVTNIAHVAAETADYQFQKPEWTRNAGLRSTGKFERLQEGKDIVRPIGGIKHIDNVNKVDVELLSSTSSLVELPRHESVTTSSHVPEIVVPLDPADADKNLELEDSISEVSQVDKDTVEPDESVEEYDEDIFSEEEYEEYVVVREEDVEEDVALAEIRIAT